MADPVAEAGTTVDRFAMIDEASGHAPLYFVCVNDTAPWGIHGDQYVRLSDFSRLESELAAERERNARLVAAGSAAYRTCMSAWASGEPAHRVKDMIDAVERLGIVLGEPGATAIRELRALAQESKS